MYHESYEGCTSPIYTHTCILPDVRPEVWCDGKSKVPNLRYLGTQNGIFGRRERLWVYEKKRVLGFCTKPVANHKHCFNIKAIIPNSAPYSKIPPLNFLILSIKSDLT